MKRIILLHKHGIRWKENLRNFEAINFKSIFEFDEEQSYLAIAKAAVDKVSMMAYKPGSRVGDLYEVCWQAEKSALCIWLWY